MLCSTNSPGEPSCFGWAHVGWRDGGYEVDGDGWAEVEGGDEYVCARGHDGTLGCWGRGVDFSGPPPEGAYSDLAVTTETACAISDPDGQVVCWGGDWRDIVDAAPTDSGYVQIEVTDYNKEACALASDGSVVCWGWEDSTLIGQTPTGSGLSNLDCGQDYCCAVDGNGEAVCWGPSNYAPPAGSGYVAVTPTEGAVYALTADGSIVASGSSPHLNSMPLSSGWLQLEAAWNAVCGLHESGNIRCWQDPGAEGAFAMLNTQYIHVDVSQAVDQWWGYLCAVTQQGEIECTGTLPDPQPWVPGQHLPPTDGLYLQVAVGPNWGCALDYQGTIECWGQDAEGLPTRNVPTGSGYQLIAGDGSSACALDAVGGVVCWGTVLGTPPAGADHTFLAVNEGFACALDAARDLVCWGDDAIAFEPLPADGPYLDVSLNRTYSCARRTVTGTVDCWTDGEPEPCGEWGEWTEAPAEGGWERVVIWQASSGSAYSYPRAWAARGDGSTQEWGCLDAGKPTPRGLNGPPEHAASSERTAVSLDADGYLAGWGSAFYEMHWQMH